MCERGGGGQRGAAQLATTRPGILCGCPRRRSRVERLLGPEAIKRGRDRRMVEARRTGSLAAERKGWDKLMDKLPL